MVPTYHNRESAIILTLSKPVNVHEKNWPIVPFSTAVFHRGRKIMPLTYMFYWGGFSSIVLFSIVLFFKCNTICIVFMSSYAIGQPCSHDMANAGVVNPILSMDFFQDGMGKDCGIDPFKRCLV